MKKSTKALLLGLCAIALVAASVMGTMAYLTSTDSVTNTFTVGNVAITLDETDVTVYGVKDTDTRVKENEYKLVPGHTYIKDPTIHVAANSEACWLFVKVENGIADIETPAGTGAGAYVQIATQITNNGWTALDGVDNVYYKSQTATATNTDVAVFGNFAIDSSKGSDDLTNYTSAEVKVTAYAIQADGFDTAAEAWTASGFGS